ncbi:MAG: endonuclease [Bacteroidetes bacterium]|nr:endonuclease [Bacteroidota bacterium]
MNPFNLFTVKNLSFLLLLSAVNPAFSQQDQVPASKNPFSEIHKGDVRRGNKAVRIMFYNVENLFDILNDSLTSDDEYTPTGMRGWTYNRLQRKINNISKVIIRLGGWEAPEIIGLCEVENRYVLSELTTGSALKNIGYKIIHRDSPDPRGIDVALLYLPDKFKPLSTKFIGIDFPSDTMSKTRDILLVEGVVLNRDTVDIFVNHWPSRFGGYLETIPKRKFVASVLKANVDSLQKINPMSKIIIMGDFNDESTDESVDQVLKAKRDSINLAPTDLYNMMTGAGTSWNRGTIKDKELWLTIDQFIVSASILQETGHLHATPHSAHILDAPFLLQDDDAWFGSKPFRTYYGPKYIGGFSDHLPIYLDLAY